MSLRREYGDDEIYIDDEATTEDANRLAAALKEADFFGNSGSSVRLRREGNRTIVSFVITEDSWKAELTIAGFRQIGADLLQAGFEQPLSIELCNDGFEMQRSIMIE